jgi:hypothetical protein
MQFSYFRTLAPLIYEERNHCDSPHSAQVAPSRPSVPWQASGRHRADGLNWDYVEPRVTTQRRAASQQYELKWMKTSQACNLFPAHTSNSFLDNEVNLHDEKAPSLR